MSSHLYGEELQEFLRSDNASDPERRSRLREMLRAPAPALLEFLAALPAPPDVDRPAAAILRGRTDLPFAVVEHLHRFERQLASLPAPLDPLLARRLSLDWFVGFLLDAIVVLSERDGRHLPPQGALSGLALLRECTGLKPWELLDERPRDVTAIPGLVLLRRTLEGLLLIKSRAAALRLLVYVSAADPRAGDATQIRRLALSKDSFVPASVYPSLWRFCADPVRS